MLVKQMEILAENDLVIGQKMLNQADLGKYLQLIIRKGEIHILPAGGSNPEQVLDDLAGCLGLEPATEYDFHLKVGGLYEAR